MESKKKKPLATQKAQLVPSTLKIRVSKSGPRTNNLYQVAKPPTAIKKQLEYNFSTGVL